VFMKHHADLLDADFWQAHKQRILAGHVHDVFPYEPHKRFAQMRAALDAPRLRLAAAS
jgi:isocitrate dehydrogenase kinase/phosphatase